MHPTMIAAVVLGCSILGACDGRPPLGSSLVLQGGSGAPAGADAGAMSAAGGPFNEKPSTELAPDSGTQADVAASIDTSLEQGEPLSCGALASGGTPDSLHDFLWQHQVTAGQSSAAFDFVWIENGCTLRYQHDNAERSTPLVAADCADARGWVTNARFLDVLRTSAGCHTDNGGNATESFELTLTDGELVARKTFLCPEPSVEAVRSCLGSLVTRLFPG
jgi:hypothetical protein